MALIEHTLPCTPTKIRVEICQKALENLSKTLLESGKKVLLVLQEPLLPYCPKGVVQWILPKGEEKTLRSAQKLMQALFEKEFGKEDYLIAFGGGSCSDLVGFVASTYQRGIPYFTVPTTLLSMIDASIGGKTGLDLPCGKNGVGSYYHPQKIYIDPQYLKTLPLQERLFGAAEGVKHGLIASPTLFEKSFSFLKFSDKDLVQWIEENIRIKLAVVQKDPFEQNGYRKILNFGHTVGHALELQSQGKLSHGLAIWMGLLVETAHSVIQGFASQETFSSLMRLVHTLHLKLPFPQKLEYDLLLKDKKRCGCYAHLICLSALGEVKLHDKTTTFPLTPKAFEEAWHYAVRHYQNTD